VLRVGHAYEQATAWHLRRPGGVRGNASPNNRDRVLSNFGVFAQYSQFLNLCLSDENPVKWIAVVIGQRT
jgi:hypothetical protein